MSAEEVRKKQEEVDAKSKEVQAQKADVEAARRDLLAAQAQLKEAARTIEANAAHGSDSPKSAERELAYFFDKADLIKRY